MQKKKIKIYDSDWNLEREFFVEIPTETEKKELEKQQQEKDYIYSNPILRFLGKMLIKFDNAKVK